MTDFEERPAKKRRFFVEDSPEPKFLHQPSNPAPADQSSIDQDQTQLNGGSRAASNDASEQTDGFDRQLFETFTGEQLPAHDLEKLQGMAGNDTQRGMHERACETL